MAWRAQEAEEEWTPPDPALPLYQLLTSKDGFLALQSYFLKAVMLSEREQVPSSLDASSPYLSAIAPVYQDTALSTPFNRALARSFPAASGNKVATDVTPKLAT